MDFKHISEIWDEFDKCKNYSEVKELISNIPSKWGEFDVYYHNEETGETIIKNCYYEKQFDDYSIDYYTIILSKKEED